MAQPPTKTSRVPAQNDVYTVLLIVAAAVLLFGTVFLAVRAQQLFGSIWPVSGA